MKTNYVLLPGGWAIPTAILGGIALAGLLIYRLSPESITLLCGLGVGLVAGLPVAGLVLASAGRRERVRPTPATPPIVILLSNQTATERYHIVTLDGQASLQEVRNVHLR